MAVGAEHSEVGVLQAKDRVVCMAGLAFGEAGRRPGLRREDPQRGRPREPGRRVCHALCRRLQRRRRRAVNAVAVDAGGRRGIARRNGVTVNAQEVLFDNFVIVPVALPVDCDRRGRHRRWSRRGLRSPGSSDGRVSECRERRGSRCTPRPSHRRRPRRNRAATSGTSRTDRPAGMGASARGRHDPAGRLRNTTRSTRLSKSPRWAALRPRLIVRLLRGNRCSARPRSSG